MTRDTAEAPDWDVSTDAEFDSALETLLFDAWDNDLDIRGVWECRNGQGYPDLEVIVTELGGES